MAAFSPRCCSPHRRLTSEAQTTASSCAGKSVSSETRASRTSAPPPPTETFHYRRKQTPRARRRRRSKGVDLQNAPSSALFGPVYGAFAKNRSSHLLGGINGNISRARKCSDIRRREHEEADPLFWGDRENWSAQMALP